MRGRFAAAGLVCLSLMVGCAERERPRPADGRLMVLGQLDFGTVVVDHRKETTLTFRNVGRSPVLVEELWTLGPDRTFEARFLPGPRFLGSSEEIQAQVAFVPRGDGPQRGQVGVRIDAREEPVLRVELRGAGVSGAALVPLERLEFGRIEVLSSKELWLDIDNPSSIPVTVSPKVLGIDRDELELDPLPFTLPPGARRQLAVTFRPERPGRKSVALAIAPCETCLDEIVLVGAEGLEQAVVAEPPAIDFGSVPIDRDAQATVSLRNLSTEPAWVEGMEIDGPSDPSFSLGAVPWPGWLAPGQAAAVTAHYTPGHMGEALGRITYRVKSRRHPSSAILVHAFGGAGELCASPAAFDFGPQPIGSRTWAQINLKSCGASNSLPVTLTEVTLDPGPSGSGGDQFALQPQALPATIPAGDELKVWLLFAPTRSGAAAAQVMISSSAFSAQRVQLSFQGQGLPHAPCELAITPAEVEFGTVAPTLGAVLGVKVENRGTDLCPVSVAMEDDSQGVFWLPGGNLDAVRLPPGYAFSFMVAFLGRVPGTYRGAVKVTRGDPGLPVHLVPLRGVAQEPCLVPIPNYVDFGLARPDCRPSPRTIRFENVCADPLQVGGMVIGPGTTDGEFVLSSPPVAWPVVVAPGAALSAQVSYLAAAPGMNLSPLFAQVEGLPAPVMVSLLGESDSHTEQTDTFTQQSAGKLDVLLVVDNTASMIEEQPRLVAALPALAEAARLAGTDLQAAVTTTGMEPVGTSCPGGALGGEAGRLVPVDGSRPRILTLALPDLGGALQANAEVGQCAFVEKGLEAARQALSAPLVDGADDPRTAAPDDGNLGFLRPDAALAVVLVGDEDDHSPDEVDGYVRFFQNLKGAGQPGRVTLNAIAPTAIPCPTAGGTGLRYGAAAGATGGEVLSICAADYAPLLRKVVQSAGGPRARFGLSSRPDPTSLVVTVDGVVLASGVGFDPGRNEVVFDVLPQGGAQISVRYRRACP